MTGPGGMEDAGLGVPGKWGKDLDGSLGNKQSKEKGAHENKLARTFLSPYLHHVIVLEHQYGREMKIFSCVNVSFMWQMRKYSL